MSTWLLTHPACLRHDTGPGHPESPERLQAVLTALERPAFQHLQRHEAPQAEIDQIARVHDRAYVERILQAVPASGCVSLDSDTLLSPGSGEAALRAAGAVCAGVDAVLQDECERVFCAVRPPGHHAEGAQAMGFCLFNNVMVGAAQAVAVHGLERVAIVDFDVHHGNGSHAMVGPDGPYGYFSTHQSPLYPGTGATLERGEQQRWNVPLEPGASSRDFRAAYEDELLPALEAYRPQLVLISAGFDGHRLDPLASLRLETDDYAWITRELCQIARRHCDNRVVSTLEGGYNLAALADATAAHVEALL